METPYFEENDIQLVLSRQKAVLTILQATALPVWEAFPEIEKIIEAYRKDPLRWSESYFF